jgi:hypothetical protein
MLKLKRLLNYKSKFIKHGRKTIRKKIVNLLESIDKRLKNIEENTVQLPELSNEPLILDLIYDQIVQDSLDNF